MLTRLLIVCSLIVLPGCATMAHPALANIDCRLPTSSEVSTYVRKYWSSFEDRFRSAAQQPGVTLNLKSVRDVQCGQYEGVAVCSFEAVAETGNGNTIVQRISGMFAYFDGKLGETVIT